MTELLTLFTLGELGEILSLTLTYQYALLEIVFFQKQYGYLQSVYPEDRWARVQVYSQGLIFKMWSHPHYRAKSLQQDMLDNLRNVAIPGTGVPLSLFCYHWMLCLLFLLVANPIVCLVGAANKVFRDKMSSSSPSSASSSAVGSRNYNTKLVEYYKTHLLHPDDWFSFWRLNCQVVSYHSLARQTPGYKQEDKWTFLKDGHAMGVPVSPFLELQSIVCKNKNIEGGMGIHFFKVSKIRPSVWTASANEYFGNATGVCEQNATIGGDWIIQEKLTNADWLNELLPENAPLSTLRIITASTWSLGKSFEDVDLRLGGNYSSYNRAADVHLKSRRH
jgi:hypothetical protein